MNIFLIEEVEIGDVDVTARYFVADEHNLRWTRHRASPIQADADGMSLEAKLNAIESQTALNRKWLAEILPEECNWTP